MEIRCPANDETYKIERDLVRPLVHGTDIKRYREPDPELCVIYPYTDKNGKTTPISEDRIRDEFPFAYEYLDGFKQRLAGRAESSKFKEWFCLSRPREKRLFESSKLIVPDVCQISEFTLDIDGNTYVSDSAYIIIPEDNSELKSNFLLAVLNSKLTWFYVYLTSSILRGDFRRFKTSYLEPLPIPQPNIEGTIDDLEEKYDSGILEILINKKDRTKIGEQEALAYLASELSQFHHYREELNLSIIDHLGNYKNGESLKQIGLIQPQSSTTKSTLENTAEKLPNLRVGTARVDRESPNTVLIETALLKMEDSNGITP